MSNACNNLCKIIYLQNKRIIIDFFIKQYYLVHNNLLYIIF